jgi:peroxiredoxin
MPKPNSYGPRPGCLRSRGCRLRLFLAVAGMLPAGVLAAERPGESPKRGTLHLTNGGYVAGALADSSDSGMLRWQAPLFAAPLEFALDGIDSVSFPAPATLPKPKGQFRFELADGDILFGSLLDLNAQEAILDVPLAGKIHVRRNCIRQFSRWKDGAALVYQGPNGLEDWTVSPSPDAWRHDRGQLETDQARAFVQGNFAIPPRAAIEFEISWKGKPDFMLAMGMGRDEATLPVAFHVEAWDNMLVLYRETVREAEIAGLQKITDDVHRAHFVIYLDQENGRCLAYAPNGKLLADLRILERGRPPLTGIRLANRRGNVRLERLQVTQWRGAPPRGNAALDKPRLHLADGKIEYRELASYNAATKSFVLSGEKESRVEADRVESVVLAPTADASSRAFSIAYQDSSRVSGKLLKIEDKQIWLESPNFSEPLHLPIAGLHSLVMSGSTKVPAEAPDDNRFAILEADGVHLPGHLVDGVRRDDASCIVWMPELGANASPLRPAIDGRIVYRETAPAPRREVRQRRGMRRVMMQNNGVARIVESPGALAQEPSHDLTRKALYLVTGDTIPCEVTRIDQNGVSFTSPFSGATFVPHDKIKAVELTLDGRGPVALTRSKRDRLLTLPRLQKSNPPTHLVRSRDGDYLRGRILEMDDRKLLIEVRLQTQEVPRDRISRIIWLHPDELPETSHAAKSSAVSAALATRVQAQLNDGNRLTFSPDRVKDSILSGNSQAIGICQVALAKVDQLLIGKAIDEAATRAAYQQWKLQYAIEPKFVQDENKSPEGTPVGTESVLVGKPAPDFDLELLDGEKFRLADHKGKIVVLDFWATWCSHCLQSMPELVRLYADSGGRDVEVVAINLEETPEQISAILDRHKWKIPVALDRDGAVAAKYGVTAIPQTVVISREGKVLRHFVGGGSNLSKNLAESVRGLTSGPVSGQTSPKAASGSK